MSRQEKRQERAERFRELSRKANSESNAAFNRSRSMSECIPFGQPILIGHHSEGRDRRFREKIHNTMGKGVELSRKADYYAQKAEAAENNTSIYLEDEDSVERLQEKVDKIEKLQEAMKATNKILQSKKLTDVMKVEALQALGYTEQTAVAALEPDRFNQVGFPSYKLTNNNARLKSAKERLEKAKRLKASVDKEYEIGEVKVVENYTENRLQLFFDGKPSDEIRSELKSNGYRWSPTNGCWQSYMNRWQLDRAKTIISKM